MGPPRRSNLTYWSSVITLQKHVRLVCRRWMARTSSRDGFTLPTADEVARYMKDKNPHHGPAIDQDDPFSNPWKFDIPNPVTSPWNRRCVEVFVDNYCQLSDARSQDREVVKATIATHHKALRQQWYHIAADKSSSMHAKVTHTARLQEVYSRRKEVRLPFLWFPKL